MALASLLHRGSAEVHGAVETCPPSACSARFPPTVSTSVHRLLRGTCRSRLAGRLRPKRAIGTSQAGRHAGATGVADAGADSDSGPRDGGSGGKAG